MARKKEDPHAGWAVEARWGRNEVICKQEVGSPPGRYFGLFHRNCMNWAERESIIGAGERAGYDSLQPHELRENEAYCALAWRFWSFQVEMSRRDPKYQERCREQLREYDRNG